MFVEAVDCHQVYVRIMTPIYEQASAWYVKSLKTSVGNPAKQNDLVNEPCLDLLFGMRTVFYLHCNRV